MRRIGALVLVVALGGCGGKIVEEPDDGPTDNAEPVAPVVHAREIPATNPFHDGDHWRGTYTCPQGLTQLDLEIVSSHDDVIDDALFVFDWKDTHGSFHLRGTFSPDSGNATFAAELWIDRPSSSWYTVGMTGYADEAAYAGNIDAPDCGSFSVTKM